MRRELSDFYHGEHGGQHTENTEGGRRTLLRSLKSKLRKRSSLPLRVLCVLPSVLSVVKFTQLTLL